MNNMIEEFRNTNMKIQLVEEDEIKKIVQRNTTRGSRRQDFKSDAEYLKNLAKRKGFDSCAEYEKHKKDILAKRKGFDSRAEYQKHLIKERGFKTWTEYDNHIAKERGYIDNAERLRECRYSTGRSSPMSENKDCSLYLGIHIAEKHVAKEVLSYIFEDVERMPYGHKGYDYLCDNEKIDVKSASLIGNEWYFSIRKNKIAEQFLLLAFGKRLDDGENSKSMHIWLVSKNVIFIRKGKAKEFWNRETITIKNTPEGLREFEKYELKEGLEHLIECCEK